MLTAIVLPAAFGFAVFMLGMKLMEAALHRAAGRWLQAAIERFTRTPLHGLLTGAAASAVLQSSTAVTVIAIGMVNAGVMAFPRTIGIVLGTNIGTCLTTELIGLNLDRLAGPLLLLSLAGWLLTALLGEMSSSDGYRRQRWLRPLRSASLVLGGFALILSGIAVMKSIGDAVQDSPFFHWFMDRSGDSLLWGLLAGAALTAAVHSSAAVIGMAMSLAASGALPMELGVAIVLGANVGTCLTAVLASIGGTRAGAKVAWFHVALNAGGALLFLPFTGWLAAASAWFGGGPASQLAHAQTLFNVLCSLIVLPLCYIPRLRIPNKSPAPRK
ncbi:MULTISPECIES: Na/Pi symporter [unclassified Paenibacillus]|uniref:Na/Pi cotransporter family protein n=1 Tax=unclassified Paenibacillus TaxID=185978 RepID=UPI0009567192|nr:MULTISPECIES: Na/Pi symporter [unclassified Paenibacillus]ASS66015.1 Na/Pi cotransporter family protein [Paenibacillus sp. RUD330]SIQ15365.1 phosphate:Na+ symporter [Paenibacillus sp. RU4X]SIQ37222.1 phosphate:Na+ symporter [Paenibacillus sp. RU4T]